MAAKFSTGLRQFLANEGSMRECYGDSKVRIFTGQAPDSPDDEESGVLLCEVSVGGEEVSDGEVSISEIYEITITHSGAPDNGDTAKIKVNGVACQAVAASDSVASLAVKLAVAINQMDDVIAIPDVNTGLILITTEVSGIPLTIVENTSTGALTVTVTSRRSAVRSDALYFDKGVAGVMNKPSGDTWIGENQHSGTAGYWRLVRSNDTGGESQAESRVQGVCSTSGAEMSLSSLIFVDEADTKLKTFRITFPEA
jgi:hypothetical protein